jgi:positive regulator of sigma E activity
MKIKTITLVYSSIYVYLSVMFILMISIFLVGEVCNNEALVHLVSLCLFVLRGWVCVNELRQWVLLIMQMM